MKYNYLPLTCVSFFLYFFSCTPSEHYDVLIKNGLVYDGSGIAPQQLDVGIIEDKIVAMGELGDNADKIIDATGKAVSPGFINMLSWANVTLIYDGRSQSDIRQGVTLEVLGEGTSMGPLNEKMRKSIKKFNGYLQYEPKWNTLGEYLTYLEEKGVSTNVASFVGNATVRQYVMGTENREPTAEEMIEMKGLVREAMEEGAIGLSSSLIYVPSGYADARELIELSKVVSEYNGMYISHIRDEGSGLLEAIDELITIAEEADLTAEIYHLKASGVKNWSKMDTAIQKINDARDRGLSIFADMYTYPASSTGLHVQMPDWLRENGIPAMIRELKKPSIRERALKETELLHPPENILFVGFKNLELKKHIGKRLSDVAREEGKGAVETMIDLFLKDNSRIQVVYFSMSEENMNKKIVQPWMSFCSDAGSYTNQGIFLEQSTHPRAYGSFVRVLGKYSRDMGILPLEKAIKKLTSLPAQTMKIKNRGLLKKGYFADVVIFDPETVTDVATFEDPHRYATGVEHVLVNGVQVIENGEHTGAKPGRFVKGPGWKPDSE